MNPSNSTMLNIAACKCPRCHTGHMFKYPLSYHPKKMLEMNDKCETCGLVFTPEPGYYYGAMFISYAFAALEMAFVFSLIYLTVRSLSTNAIMVILTTLFLLLAPLNFRLGRAGWISIFYRYDSSYAKKLVHHKE